MILAGVALSSLFTGGATLVQYFADDVVLASVVYWTFGDLGRAGWNETGLIFLVLLVALAYFLLHSWSYNALQSGPQTAKSLGVPVERLTLVTMTLAALLSAAAVSFVGIINFVGLIAPHMVRRLVGSDHRFLLPASGAGGGPVCCSSAICWPGWRPPHGCCPSARSPPFWERRCFSISSTRGRNKCFRWKISLSVIPPPVLCWRECHLKLRRGIAPPFWAITARAKAPSFSACVKSSPKVRQSAPGWTGSAGQFSPTDCPAGGLCGTVWRSRPFHGL